MTLIRAILAAGERAAALPALDGPGVVERAIAAIHLEIAGLRPGDVELLTFVAWETLAPRAMTREHLVPLRAVGFSDLEIHDVVHVVCCFSYMNRLADALGVTLKKDRVAFARRLFGDASLEAHLAWGEAR